MSDIAMNFDGLATLMLIVLGAVLYIMVAVVAVVVFFATQRPRARSVARRSGLLGVAAACVAILFTVIWAQLANFPKGIDLLSIPTIAGFLVGCWWLFRPGADVAAAPKV